ncbi:hypothetical protein [Streptomyces sp. NBC_00503]|uniref:hypothetical protein n=1 Tax=Streptomyces sp. NBC_00503 TaxID=2903659 RepID=UPI002E8135DD|nr:hypothetical protein [Streptomyces sp. NBC_00503]WUD79244.1 hypothetical protein OG490_00885 [Streptomyces sp. NBC_00503]
MRGNTSRALVALVLAAGIGWGGAATSASAASEVPGAGHRVSADAKLPRWLDPGKDCPVTTAWGDENCPPRQY